MLIKFFRPVKTLISTLHVTSFLNVRPRKIKIASVCVFSPKGNIKIGNDFFARFSKKELKSILENIKSLYSYSDIVIYEKFGITLKDI
jgi:hypothetical protein